MEIVFASPHCALDRSSGAAISVTTQLEQLASLGWTCRTVTGTITSSAEPFDRHFAALGVRRAGQCGGSILLGTDRHGVEHRIVPMHGQRRGAMTSDDEERYFAVVRAQIRSRRPDLVYVYGKRLLEQAILREARRQGIATAFYLANAGYGDPAPFADADAVFTPSKALARFYRERLGLAAESIGSFTHPLVRSSEPGESIVFVNPERGKGVSFLFQIARQCLVELPEARFVVVESRHTRESSARMLGIDWDDVPNVSFVGQQPDLTAILGAARVLLFPALAFDAAPRILVEANHLGLPAISSAHGGSPEMLDGAGFLIDIPQRYRDAPMVLPDADAVEPWVRDLTLLLRDPAAHAAARRRAGAAAGRHALTRLAGALSDRLALLAARRG